MKVKFVPGSYNVYYDLPETAKWCRGASYLDVAGCYYRITNCWRALMRDFGEISLTFQTDPKNSHDRNAIKILADGIHIGFVAREDQEIVKAAIAEGGTPLIRKIYFDRRGCPDIHYGFYIPAPPKTMKRPKTIKFSCPNCEQHYEVSTPRTDKMATCTVCGEQFTIPAWTPPPPEPPSPVIIPRVSVPSPVKQQPRGAGLIVTGLVALAVIIILICKSKGVF